MSKNKKNQLNIAFVSTYPPRECGIATFTSDLIGAISSFYGLDLKINSKIEIIALTDLESRYNYGNEVSFEIHAQNKPDYLRAAEFLNISDVDVISVQHEFGIYGGPDGRYLLSFLENLKKPVITTLHTILDKPTDSQKEILSKICRFSSEVVVLADKGFELLTKIYGVPKSKIKKIHHGAPDVPFMDPSYYKEEFNMEGHPLILTYGLLSPDKGLDVVINALAEVVKEYPEVIYIILGETHPNVKSHSGEEYRYSLKNLVDKNHLEENVVFHNRFVTLKELIKYLVMADIYITPYNSEEQISSGTLSYAVACGKAIISTPYWHAQELLDDGRGILVPFGDVKAIAEAIKELVKNKVKRDKIRKATYKYGRKMIWKEVASSYVDSFEKITEKFKSRKRKSISVKKDTGIKVQDLPELNLCHLLNLTDDTGIFQHSKYSIPNRRYGYTTDDNARAAIVALKVWNLFKDDCVLPMLIKYLSFLSYSYDQDKEIVRNELSFDRRWLKSKASEDHHGRLVWALGNAISYPPREEISHFAIELLFNCLKKVASFSSPRAWAFSILGITKYLNKFPEDKNAQNLNGELASRLLNLFKENSSDDWIWVEDIVSYENARLPQALLEEGRLSGNKEMKEWGLDALKWLINIQTDQESGYLSVIGNKGWFKRNGKKTEFDQQPVEVAALIDACYEAYLSTEDKFFLDKINWAFRWFFGQNVLEESLYDPKTGGCKDGLLSSGVNKNEGSESLLSWLLSLLKMYEITTL
jgi:glycosyltransferase involved in cell wall biosynthesis